jgi:putative peptidoglycan lipid II flippase
MIFSLAGVAVNVVVNLLLVDSMQHEGLALGTSCAAIANACLLYAGLRKNHGINVILEWGKIIRIAIASSISVGVSFLSYKGLVATIWMPRMVYLGIAVCIAIAIYISLLKFFKIEELRFLTFLLKRRKAE